MQRGGRAAAALHKIERERRVRDAVLGAAAVELVHHFLGQQRRRVRRQRQRPRRRWQQRRARRRRVVDGAAPTAAEGGGLARDRLGDEERVDGVRVRAGVGLALEAGLVLRLARARVGRAAAAPVARVAVGVHRAHLLDPLHRRRHVLREHRDRVGAAGGSPPLQVQICSQLV